MSLSIVAPSEYSIVIDKVVSSIDSEYIQGLESINGITRCSNTCPLGRYYATTTILLYLSWFPNPKDDLFIRTIKHEIGHHVATTILDLEDKRLNEEFARYFEGKN